MLGWKAAGLSPFEKLGFLKLIILILMKERTIRFNRMYTTNTRNFLPNTFFLRRRVLMRYSTIQNSRNKIPCSLQNMDTTVIVERVRNLAAVALGDGGSQERQRREERRKQVEYSRSARPTMLTTGSTCTGWQPKRPLVRKLRRRECEDFVRRVNFLRRKYSRRVLVLCRRMLSTLYCLAVIPSVSWF